MNYPIALKSVHGSLAGWSTELLSRRLYAQGMRMILLLIPSMILIFILILILL